MVASSHGCTLAFIKKPVNSSQTASSIRIGYEVGSRRTSKIQLFLRCAGLRCRPAKPAMKGGGHALPCPKGARKWGCENTRTGS